MSRELEEQAFAFDHYAIIQGIHQSESKTSRLESDLPLSVGGGVAVYEGTELVNLINPGLNCQQ